MSDNRYCWWEKFKHNYKHLTKPKFCDHPQQCESCSKFVAVCKKTEEILSK